MREAKDSGVIHFGCITGYFNLGYLFKNTKVTVNTRHNLVEPILSNSASPIGGIKKV